MSVAPHERPLSWRKRGVWLSVFLLICSASPLCLCLCLCLCHFKLDASELFFICVFLLFGYLSVIFRSDEILSLFFHSLIRLDSRVEGGLLIGSHDEFCSWTSSCARRRSCTFDQPFLKVHSSIWYCSYSSSFSSTWASYLWQLCIQSLVPLVCAILIYSLYFMNLSQSHHLLCSIFGV
jgi:hypothetical protein